jgi:hypothetical protein
MRDISFLEWFLLGMPVEWFIVTVVAGAAFLIWAAATTRPDRRRRERRGGRDGRGPPRDR